MYLDGVKLSALADELEKIALPRWMQATGDKAKFMWNSANAAVGRAMTDQAASGRSIVSPVGTPDLPIIGAASNFIGDHLPKTNVHKSALGKTLGRIASSTPVKTTVGLADRLSTMVKLAQVAPYQQKTQHTCSAACLKAVLEHWGHGQYAEHEVADMIGVRTKGGAEVDQITDAARKLGFAAFEYGFESLEQAKVLTDQDIPIIADIQSFNHPGSGHYVVITKIGDGEVHLMDPNTEGNTRVLTYAEMEERWWDRRMAPPHDLMPMWGVIVAPEKE